MTGRSQVTARHAHHRSARRAGAWLALATALACLFTAGGSMTSLDGVVAFNVTQNLIENGSIATSGGVIELEAYRGRDGLFYSPFGIAQSIWNVPFYLAGRAAADALPRRIGRSDTVPKAVVVLATIPAVAILAWAGFAILIGLEVEPRKAVIVAALMIFATPLWPYSGFGFNQPLAGMFLWLAVLGLISGVRRGSDPALLAAGLAVGGAVLTRHEMLLPAAVVAIWLALQPANRRSRRLAFYLGGVAPAVLVWGALNWWRFGNPLESGYLRDSTPGIGSSIVTGTTGLLFSPYASLFLYCPVAVLVFPALGSLWRRDRSSAALLIAVFLSCFLLYASLANWMGGRSYGPRYLVPLLPALVLPLAFWKPAGWLRWTAAVIVGMSVAVQIPGVLVDYSKVREDRARAGETVAQDTRWSGMPLRLNTVAAREAVRRAFDHLSGREAPPRIGDGDQRLYRALSFSLDLWWLNLFYLGVIGATSAVLLGVGLAAAAALAMARALTLARTCTPSRG